MKDHEISHIDHCVAAIADGGASDDDLRKLGEMLEGHADLQDYYARTLRHQLLIQNELNLTQLSFRSVVPETMELGTCGSGTSCRELAQRMDIDLADSVNDRPRRVGRPASRSTGMAAWSWPGTIAGMMLIALLATQFFRKDASSNLPPANIATVPEKAPTPESSVEIPSSDTVVRNDRALHLLSQITRTEAISGIRFTSSNAPLGGESAGLPSTGTAWLERNESGVERGYLVALEPGQQMDVRIDASAISQNALSMMEIASDGRIGGGWSSFNNLLNDDISLPLRRQGCVGRCSEYNATDATRYFLFAGSHILPQQSEDENWYQSDCRVRLQQDELLVVGWDDRGYEPASNLAFDDYDPDLDYNDMVATIHLHRPESMDAVNAAATNTVDYSPAPLQGTFVTDDIDRGCTLEVPAGKRLVMTVTCNAELQNGFRIVESKTQQILWMDEGTPYVKDKSQPSDRGVFVITNFTDEPQQYLFQALRRSYGETQEDPWRVSSLRKFAGGKDHLIFGFEDSPHIYNHRDWHDISVIAHWFDLD
jgi:hypothetical protein